MDLPAKVMDIFHMDRLDDYTLRLIIDYLPIEDKIMVERVSKQWRELALKSARQVKCLNLPSDFKGIDLKINDIKKILFRCGENLNQIGLNGEKLDVKPSEIFTLVNQFCKNLTTLVFQELVLENDLNFLSEEIVKNLKAVFYCEVHIKNSSSVAAFIKKAINLKNLVLRDIDNHYFEDYGLQHLSKMITRLDISCMFLKNRSLFKSCIDNLPNLKHLSILWTNISSGDLINVCQRLKTIKLACSDLMDNRDYRNLSFPQVEELDVGHGTHLPDDDFIHFLRDKVPNLKRLDLYDFWIGDYPNHEDPVPDYLKVLARLQNLECLDVTQTGLSDDVIKYWMLNNFKFKRIVCALCDYLTNVGLIEMVSSLPDLKFIQISSNTGVQIKELLEEMLKLVALRNNGVPLKLKLVHEPKPNVGIEEFRLKMKSNFFMNYDVKVEFFTKNIVKFIPLSKNSTKN